MVIAIQPKPTVFKICLKVPLSSQTSNEGIQWHLFDRVNEKE